MKRNGGDIVIVGGGVIGLSTAYYLAKEGADVTLLDKGDFGQEASWAGAGIIPPGNAAAAKTPFDRLRGLSVALFPNLSEELREWVGIDNGYRRSGGLELLEAEVASTDAEWRSDGIRAERLSEAELRRLEPALSAHMGAAMHLPDLAQLRNPWHLRALVAACAACRVRLLSQCPMHDFVVEGGRIRGLNTFQGRMVGDRFLLAGGAWTDALLRSLDCHTGVVPVRGQIVLLRTEKPLIHRVLLFGPRYLVPRDDGRVLVGSTEEHAGFDKSTTASAIRDLIDLACRLVPALADAAVEKCWSGLRPGSPDGLPFLDRVPGWENLFVAAGHFRSGIQLSPGTALVMKEMLLDQPLSMDITPFQLNRT
ncbi:MAG: glycine oxidase ThiO [Gemmataceae bacterium]|nr:glycine oxidase ThiO [Gemmataceae bacterium]MCI0740558.1 glycine oxidase ThiO [Gemmataceae bacterium]